MQHRAIRVQLATIRQRLTGSSVDPGPQVFIVRGGMTPHPMSARAPGRRSWTRGDDESARDFERRVIDDAKRLNVPVILSTGLPQRHRMKPEALAEFDRRCQQFGPAQLTS